MKGIYRLLAFTVVATTSPAQFFDLPSHRDWADRTVEASNSWGTVPDEGPGGSISMARLRHQPPRKARQAFLRGMKFSQAGADANAAAEFAKAAKFDPDFSEAHGNLGVEYTWLNRYEDAVPEFRRAITLDPATSFHHSNLAYTLIRLNSPHEAEAEAQTAVGLDGTNATAQFLLGLLLARRPETRALCESHLVYAARTIPEAHRVLAWVYRAQGAAQNSGVELESYRRETASGRSKGRFSLAPRP